MFAHTTKSRSGSSARPGPNIRVHQRSTSAEPVKAWHTTTALSPEGESSPQVRKAVCTRGSVAPDSSTNGPGGTNHRVSGAMKAARAGGRGSGG
jgi:hypothetical protein